MADRVAGREIRDARGDEWLRGEVKRVESEPGEDCPPYKGGQRAASRRAGGQSTEVLARCSLDFNHIAVRPPASRFACGCPPL
jgi:hypothetical protein